MRGQWILPKDLGWLQDLSAETRRRLIMSITRVASNVNANFAAANLSKIDNGLSSTLARLSSGMRINSSADDPAGVASSAVLKSKISALDTAIQNAQEAIGFMETVDSYMSQGIDLVTRMKDIAIEAGNSATLTTSQLDNLQTEFNNLRTQLQVLNGSAKYGDLALFTGKFSGAGTYGFQVGLAASNYLTIGFSGIQNVVSVGAGLTVDIASFDVPTSLDYAFNVTNSAVALLANTLGSVGVQSRRLDLIITQLEDQRANAISANSNVSDADLAAEITNLATAQIRTQAATAAMAQANALPQTIMQLLNRM